jgi:hypothetical protein
LKYDTEKGREIFLLYAVMIMASFFALLVHKEKQHEINTLMCLEGPYDNEYFPKPKWLYK